MWWRRQRRQFAGCPWAADGGAFGAIAAHGCGTHPGCGMHSSSALHERGWWFPRRRQSDQAATATAGLSAASAAFDRLPQVGGRRSYAPLLKHWEHQHLQLTCDHLQGPRRPARARATAARTHVLGSAHLRWRGAASRDGWLSGGHCGISGLLPRPCNPPCSPLGLDRCRLQSSQVLPARSRHSGAACARLEHAACGDRDASQPADRPEQGWWPAGDARPHAAPTLAASRHRLDCGSCGVERCQQAGSAPRQTSPSAAAAATAAGRAPCPSPPPLRAPWLTAPQAPCPRPPSASWSPARPARSATPSAP